MPHLLLNAEGTVVSKAEGCLPQGSLQGGGGDEVFHMQKCPTLYCTPGKEDQGGVGGRYR